MSQQIRNSRRRSRGQYRGASHESAGNDASSADDADDDFRPLLGSLGEDRQRNTGHRRYPASSRRMRPMAVAVAPHDFNKSSGAITEGDSESSEDVPLLQQQKQQQHPPSRMASSTFLGVEGRTYRSTALPSRNRRHPRRRRRVNAWDQAASGQVLVNSNPIKEVGCCRSGGCCMQCVRTGEVGLLQSFGRFERILPPGLVCMFWPCCQVGRLSLRVKQVDMKLESKTRDAVFVTIGLSVQYRVVRADAFQAYYSLTDPGRQIVALVYDAVRSKVPQLDVDELFISSSVIADAVGTKVDFMRRYGYEIVNTLVTSISPVESVRRSMNDINASKRLKDGAPYRAEGAKIARVKAAEAEAEKSYLNGIGVARARAAIASSMKASLLKLDVKESLRPKHVMDLLLVSHYMDTLTALGAESIVLMHTPDEIGVLKGEIAEYFESSPVAMGTGNEKEKQGMEPDLLLLST